MLPNCRIFLNIVATCGRSLCAGVCGVVVGRWVVAALGKSELGLCGLVDGMMVGVVVAFAMRLVRGGSAAAMRWTSGEMV